MVQFVSETTDMNPKHVELITDVLRKQGFENAKVSFKPVGDSSDNYVANVKRIVAEKNGTSFTMIAKLAPTLETLRKTMNTHIAFENEYVMYSQVLPKFTEMEEDAGIPESERLRYAKFYGAVLEEPSEIILLEDLLVPGFVMLDKNEPLANETIRLVLKNFAKLHSRSYALRNQEPETFDNFRKALYDNFSLIFKSKNSALYFKNVEDDALALLSSSKYKKVLKNSIGNAWDILHGLHKTDYESRYSVIVQGDSWTNNIMFKFQGMTLSECCLIDYQVARVNTPVADLHYMIFACTDYESRAKYFHEWIDYYHSELSKALFEFGLKSDYWYPRDRLDADLKRHGRASLVYTLFLASIVSREAGDADQVKDTIKNIGAESVDLSEMLKANSITNASELSQSLFKAKIAENLDSLIELGFL